MEPKHPVLVLLGLLLCTKNRVRGPMRSPFVCNKTACQWKRPYRGRGYQLTGLRQVNRAEVRCRRTPAPRLVENSPAATSPRVSILRLRPASILLQTDHSRNVYGLLTESNHVRTGPPQAAGDNPLPVPKQRTAEPLGRTKLSVNSFPLIRSQSGVPLSRRRPCSPCSGFSGRREFRRCLPLPNIRIHPRYCGLLRSPFSRCIPAKRACSFC
jgi:hypothetical protein